MEAKSALSLFELFWNLWCRLHFSAQKEIYIYSKKKQKKKQNGGLLLSERLGKSSIGFLTDQSILESRASTAGEKRKKKWVF